jgi:hypothetical protein
MSQANKLTPTPESQPGLTIPAQILSERSQVMYDADQWADLCLGLAIHTVMGPKPADQSVNTLATSVPEAAPKIVPVLTADQISAIMTARDNVEESYRNA